MFPKQMDIRIMGRILQQFTRLMASQFFIPRENIGVVMFLCETF